MACKRRAAQGRMREEGVVGRRARGSKAASPVGGRRSDRVHRDPPKKKKIRKTAENDKKHVVLTHHANPSRGVTSFSSVAPG